MLDRLLTLLSDETLLLYLGGFSILFFISTLIVIPWLILQIPEDYFLEASRHSFLTELHHPVIKILLLIIKNLFGVFFIFLGIALLVLPGQGLLTILLGSILLDFPGKFRLQRWFVHHHTVLHSINWLRKKGHRPPIRI